MQWAPAYCLRKDRFKFQLNQMSDAAGFNLMLSGEGAAAEVSSERDAAGASVGEVLGNLTTQFPDLRKQIYNDEGKLRSFVNVYLNDEDIRYLQKDATAVKAGDTLSIVPSIAGGVE